MLCPSLTTEEMRQRVREAEALLRVASQHARDAREDPGKSAHASARIQAICKEVEGMFPGMHDPAGLEPEVEQAMQVLKVGAETAIEAREAEGDAGTTAGTGTDTDAGTDAEADDEADAEGDGEVEWDVDYVKLGAAIENEELMSKFPEPARTAFRKAARYLADSLERQELFSRVVDAFEQLSALTTESLQETQRKLAMTMTIDALSKRN